MGMVDGNNPVSDNAWESVKKGGEPAIKRWIANQMYRRSCTVVLVGRNTANRKWIIYEIVKSWNDQMGVVGIHVQGLKNVNGKTALKGGNLFDYIHYGNTGKRLSSVVKCNNPSGRDSQARYAWIKDNLAATVEEAIRIRKKN